MRRTPIVACALALGLATVPGVDVSGQDPVAVARVRASIVEDGPVVVGQPVHITVEVLVPTFFRGAPRFAGVDLDGAITVFNERGTNFVERDGGTTWAGQRRSYTVYPNQVGTYDVPPIAVIAPYGDGSRVVTDTVRSNPVRFEAVVPAEARGLPAFVAAAALSLDQSIDPRPDTIRVGDAFTRTITTVVDGTLSLVIPPLAFDSVPGLGSYPSPPRVDDEGGDRGTAVTGTRVESVSYVARAEGEYTLPPIVIEWWDWTADRLRRAEVAGLTFTVEANPDLAPEIALPPDSLDVPEQASTTPTRVSLGAQLRRWLPRIAVVVAVLLLGYRTLSPRLATWRAGVAEARRRRADSEAAAFRRLREVARSGDPRGTANALSAWLAHVPAAGENATFRALARQASDPELTAELQRLDDMLFGSPPSGTTAAPTESWSGEALASRLSIARKRLTASPTRRPSALPAAALGPLNP